MGPLSSPIFSVAIYLLKIKNVFLYDDYSCWNVDIISRRNLEKWVINFNEQSEVNNVNSKWRILRRETSPTFFFRFLSVDKMSVFEPVKKFKKVVQQSPERCNQNLSAFFPQRFQIVTCVIWKNHRFINILMLVTL